MKKTIYTKNLQGLEALAKIIDGFFPSTAIIAVERINHYIFKAEISCISAEIKNLEYFIRRCSL